MSKSLLVLAGLLVGANALAADSPPATTHSTAMRPALTLTRSWPRRVRNSKRPRVMWRSCQRSWASRRWRGCRTLRTRAVLGLQLQTQTSTKEQGATVMGVSPGGPAAEAGLAPGDVIVALERRIDDRVRTRRAWSWTGWLP